MTDKFADVRRMVDMNAPTQVRGVRTSNEVLGGVEYTAGGAGMILGREHGGQLAVRELFSSEPREILAVGTIGLAKVLAFRALALGAQVWVETRRVAAWDAFIRTSAGASGAIRVVREFPDARFASEDRPVFVLVDSDSSLAEDDQVGLSWTTVLTLYSQLTPWNVADLTYADLAILQKLTPAEARLAAGSIRGSDLAQRLEAVSHNELGLLSGSNLDVVTLELTAVERYMIGDVSRTRRRAAARD
ncbi:hypothetical protein [Cumulibacter soli]|uniref:hypothetical protein n=1 Tax=Cumulibacter soli TaxID=2546344 RepID=UPI00106775D7|nr:hypothetical protein [Cumulibacter soli]